MSDSVTIARPYAKAIFEHALADHKLDDWSSYLLNLAHAVTSPKAARFLTNPAVTVDQQVDLLHAVASGKAKEDKGLNNLIALLANNKRLSLLPEIKALYEQQKSEHEKTLVVDVYSYEKISAEQQKKLVEALSNKLKRHISLKISIDPALLGGALIQAGDLVIDGSVRGKLNKLMSELAA